MKIETIIKDYEKFEANKGDLLTEISDNNIDKRLQLGFALLNESIYGSSRTNQDRLGQSLY